MISVISIRRPAKENGPIMPAITGRFCMRVLQLRIASRYNAVRPDPVAGIFKASASCGVCNKAPHTVGTSSDVTRICTPKASAPTERSSCLKLQPYHIGLRWFACPAQWNCCFDQLSYGNVHGLYVRERENG